MMQAAYPAYPEYELTMTLSETSPSRDSILLIERSDELRRNLSDILHFEGYTVVGAETAGDGLRLLTVFETPPRLVICEINRDGMSAAQFLDAALAVTHDTTGFLFVTTHEVLDLPAETGSLRSTFHLQKPFFVGDLLAIVRSALDT